jgi:hypothetical protein
VSAAQPKVTYFIGAVLRPVASTFRRRIKAAYAAQGREGRMNDEDRLALEGLLFAEQNELEHRMPRHVQVEVMNLVRNVLLDDIAPPEKAESGGNDTHAKHRRDLKWPAVQMMRELMVRRGSAREAARIGQAKVDFLIGKAGSFEEALARIPEVQAKPADEDDESESDDACEAVA